MSEGAPAARLTVLAFLCLGALVSLLAVARAETVTGDALRVDFRGSILPRTLPRSVPAPVSLHVEGSVRPLGAERPAPLARLSVEVNRHAIFTTRGLPICPRRELRGTDTEEALARCAGALIGSGYFTSHIEIPEQAPFPAWGRVLAFNTRKQGHEAVAIHVFGRRPAATSTLLSAALLQSGGADGQFGPQLTIAMPRIGEDWGYVSGFGLTLHRRFRYRGAEHSLVSATCPAPTDLPEVPFKAARGSFELADGRTLRRTIGGRCRAAGRP